MNWIHTKPPPMVRLKIFTHSGQVREGTSDGVHVHLSDCVHPMENAIYPADLVVAWDADMRIADSATERKS